MPQGRFIAYKRKLVYLTFLVILYSFYSCKVQGLSYEEGQFMRVINRVNNHFSYYFPGSAIVSILDSGEDRAILMRINITKARYHYWPMNTRCFKHLPGVFSISNKDLLHASDKLADYTHDFLMEDKRVPVIIVCIDADEKGYSYVSYYRIIHVPLDGLAGAFFEREKIAICGYQTILRLKRSKVVKIPPDVEGIRYFSNH
jgi:hypothetical protein